MKKLTETIGMAAGIGVVIILVLWGCLMLWSLFINALVKC